MQNVLSPIVFLLFCTNIFAQNNHTISGFITDINNGESIVGANIYCRELNLGVTSNTYGFYSLTLPEGLHEISFSFIGYKTETKDFNLNSSVEYNVEFELSSVNMQEVVVTAKKNIVEQTQTSVIEIPIEQIKAIPAFLGEVDRIWLFRVAL